MILFLNLCLTQHHLYQLSISDSIELSIPDNQEILKLMKIGLKWKKKYEKCYEHLKMVLQEHERDFQELCELK